MGVLDVMLSENLKSENFDRNKKMT